MSYIFTLTTPERKSWDGEYYAPAKTVTIELESSDLTVDQLCSAFQDFLKGCGFYVDHGTIQLVEHDDISDDRDYPPEDQPESDSETSDPSPSVQTEFNFSAALPEEPKGSADV